MKLKQLSVFLENKPGRLNVPCKALADAGIDLLTLCMADTEKFGILRFIVRTGNRRRRFWRKPVVPSTSPMSSPLKYRIGQAA